MDNSTNCDPVEHFVERVKLEVSQIRVRENMQKPLTIYIATNEWNETTLQYLQASGFKIFKDIESNLNSLDIFIVELQLMIYAKYYLQWGVSSIHDFVKFAKTNNNPPIEINR